MPPKSEAAADPASSSTTAPSPRIDQFQTSATSASGQADESYQELLSDEVSLVSKVPSVRVRRRGSSVSRPPTGESSPPPSGGRGRRASSIVGWPARRGSVPLDRVPDEQTSQPLQEIRSGDHVEMGLMEGVSPVEEEKRPFEAQAGLTSPLAQEQDQTAADHVDTDDPLFSEAKKTAKAEEVLAREAGTRRHGPHFPLPLPHFGGHKGRHQHLGIVGKLAKKHREKSEAQAEQRRQKRIDRWAKLGGSDVDVDSEAQRVASAPRMESGGDQTPPTPDEEQTYNSEVVDVLDVMDPQVSTMSHLANIGNSIVLPYIPSLYNRRPMIDLPEADTPNEADENPQASSEERDEEALDQHVKELLTKRQKAKRIGKGLLGYLCTWQGAIVGVYGLLVVFWGAALVIFLAGWIDHGNNKDFWVEVCSQILTALFTLTGVGLIPWRLRDTWWMLVISHYQHKTWRLRRQEGLAPLKDPNALPASEGRPKLGGGQSKASLSTIDSGEGHADRGDAWDDENDVQVLSESQAARLHRVQAKFAASASWYRPQETSTHHAFPISYALMITLLNDGNSIFQILLCITMWYFAGFSGDPPRYKARPSWQTACGITFSFSCGIGAAVLIYLGGEKTKKKNEVEAQVRRALKKGKGHSKEHIAPAQSQK